MTASSAATPTTPTRKQIKRWQRYLANERAEAAVYRELALKKQGEEREILLGIAEAEARGASPVRCVGAALDVGA